MIKSAINTVLFTTLMLGGIAPNTGSFIEDDTDFNKTFSKGWGWLTVNSANAGSREQSEVETLAVYGAPPEYEWNYYGNSGEDNTGLFEDSLGGSDGGGGGDDTAEEERLEKVHACKVESIDRTERCIRSAVVLHDIDSAWCSAAKWLGGALGVGSGWAAVEGEGAGAFILGGAGMAVYQIGDDCQMDMDRVLTASTAICTTDQARRDLDCDAIK